MMNMGSSSSSSSSAMASATSISSMDMDMDTDSMNMYFTTNYKDYPVMFKGLHASTSAGVFGIFCVLFFGGFALRGLSFLSFYLEQHVFKTQPSNVNIIIEENNGCGAPIKKFDINSSSSDATGVKVVSSYTQITGIKSRDRVNAVLTNAGIKPHVDKSKSSILRQLFFPTPGEIFKDIVRVTVYFVTAMVSFALMIAAMSYIVVYFFAICLGVAFGEVFFNKLRILTDSTATETVEDGDICGGGLC